MKGITASCVIGNHVVARNGVILFDGRHVHDNKHSGENKSTDLSVFLLSTYQHFSLDYPRFYKMDNLSKLGWLAAEVVLKEGFRAGNYRPEEIGVVLANANSSLDTDLKYFETVKDIPSPSVFVYTLPNIMTGEICIRNGFKGENAFFVSDRFNACLIEQYVSYLLDNDILQACICGWVDLLGEEYKAVLFLVEKKNRVGAVTGESIVLAGEPVATADEPIAFTVEHMNEIFHGDGKHGEVNREVNG